ncbi:MAG: transketolase [Firmicutes bacterium HGW-Firmicutes-16]|nr:MAG: transketolase [Firmicutes bacterium HGW-Firmicutes-16]
MKFLLDNPKIDEHEMRAVYCDALISAARENSRIVAVDADVQYSMGTKRFYDVFPERGINCGIMEAHGVGMCAGMSATGLIPFFHAFGTFATRRVFDQIFISCAYQKLNVKIIGGDAGVTATANGGTHMPFEDMALMRAVPGATVIEPADTAMYETAVKLMADTYGVFYMRSSRRKVTRIYSDSAKFTIGKANLLEEGCDVAIVACGIMVLEALRAREMLLEKGISAAVLDMHTIKPLDEEAIVKAAQNCGAVVTAENHNAIGGLGSAVSEVLSEKYPVPLERVAVFESFGEVGTQDYLQERFHLTARDIAEKAEKCIRRKNENSRH